MEWLLNNLEWIVGSVITKFLGGNNNVKRGKN